MEVGCIIKRSNVHYKGLFERRDACCRSVVSLLSWFKLRCVPLYSRFYGIVLAVNGQENCYFS